MNEFNRKPAHAVPNWQAPASTGKKQPAIDESQVEGAVFGPAGEKAERPYLTTSHIMTSAGENNKCPRAEICIGWRHTPQVGSSPPAESANKAGKKGRGGRETAPTAAPTAAQTPALPLPLPTRPIEPSLYPTADFNAMDLVWSSRVDPVDSDDVAVFR